MVRLIIAAVLAAAVSLSGGVAQARDGKALFEEYCAKCHGEAGTPPKAMKKKFPKVATFDAKFVAAHSQDSIVKVLTRGKNEDMVSFKMKMSPEELVIVAKYVRELGSKNGTP